MNTIKAATQAAASLVAGVAGYSSYRHIVDVAISAGENSVVAHLIPAGIDGLIIVGTMAMLDDKRNNRHPRMSARVAMGFGIAATLAANVASAEPNWTARAVAAVPAIAFLIAVEVLSRVGKPRAETAAPTVARPSAPARTAPVPSAPSTEGRDRPDVPAEVPARKPQARTRPAAAAAPKAQKRPAEVVRRTAEEMLATDPTPTRKEVAAEIGITDRRLRQVLNTPTGEQPVIEARTPAEVSA